MTVWFMIERANGTVSGHATGVQNTAMMKRQRMDQVCEVSPFWGWTAEVYVIAATYEDAQDIARQRFTEARSERKALTA